MGYIFLFIMNLRWWFTTLFVTKWWIMYMVSQTIVLSVEAATKGTVTAERSNILCIGSTVPIIKGTMVNKTIRIQHDTMTRYDASAILWKIYCFLLFNLSPDNNDCNSRLSCCLQKDTAKNMGNLSGDQELRVYCSRSGDYTLFYLISLFTIEYGISEVLIVSTCKVSK